MTDTEEETRVSLLASLRRMNLIEAGEGPILTPLTGGVSSLVVRVDAKRGTFCLKRALPKLKVAREWFAPVERSRFEVAWLLEAAAIVPGAVPEIIGEDEPANTFAMEFLDPSDYAVWKSRLLAHDVDPSVAVAVGRILGRLHAATADRDDIRQRFDTSENFTAIRIEPYLYATARVHADRAEALHRVAATTLQTRHVLVHGDVSPKNILVGRERTILLDAECAWYGDPAFDLAFCLNHFLLKSSLTDAPLDRYAASFNGLAAEYLRAVDWEKADALEIRAAALLPGLMLARIDGKSPVEYIEDDVLRGRVRGFSRAFLARPAGRLSDIWDAWEKELHR